MASKHQSAFRSFTIKPVSGELDLRVTPDEVQIGSYRERQSWECLQKGKMCRMSGFKHLCAEEYQNNADLHDQLLAIAGPSHIRQPIILAQEVVQPLGLNKLFAATQNRIYALNNSTGNWKIISDLLGGSPLSGCPDTAWWLTGSNDVVVITNGVDKPVFHIIDQPADANGQSVSLIKDCELLNISAVGVVWTWEHLTFYGNVTMDGVKASYRVLWSDYDRPLSLKPKANISLAGYFDMAFGEVILNALPMGNVLFIYTNLGIWQVSKGGSVSSPLSFTKRYDAPRPGERCLIYPRTLVSSGNHHYYMSGDDIYLYSLYVDAPQRVEWIRKASSVIFEDIDKGRCNTPVAGFESSKKQIFFFWANSGQDCPQQGLVLNTETDFASTVPFGATAVCNFGANKQMTLRDFMLSKCICQPNQLPFEKEGGYCTTPTAPSCPTPPKCFYTNSSINLDGRLIEDVSKLSADQDSLCAQLGNLSVGDLCNSEFSADQCRPEAKFVFALSDDFCLKEADENAGYRERTVSFTGCGGYSKLGYRSPLRSGPMDLANPEVSKWLTKFICEVYPVLQTIPSLLVLKVGAADRAIDPNAPDCLISFDLEMPPLPLKCPVSLTADEAKAQGVYPDEDFSWRTYMGGRFLYYELDIINPDVNPPDTGGLCCISRFTLEIQTLP